MWTAERYKFNQGIKLKNTSYASGFNYGWLKIRSTWVLARICKMKSRLNVNLEVMIPKLKDFLGAIRGFLIFICNVFTLLAPNSYLKLIFPILFFKIQKPQRGEEGQPHQSLVRTTFSLFSRPNHIEILVLSIWFFFKVSDPWK